jgi:ketosteroid isomerase-like protein
LSCSTRAYHPSSRRSLSIADIEIVPKQLAGANDSDTQNLMSVHHTGALTSAWRQKYGSINQVDKHQSQQRKDRKMASTKDILDNHLGAFFKRDLHRVLSDYAPDAVMFTQDGTLKGVDSIRPLFQALFAEFGKGRPTFNMQRQTIEGDCGYIVWAAETADNVYEMATDTFVVRAGKIVTQSFTAKRTSKG